MTSLPIIHNVPFSQMSLKEQYDLVQDSHRAALHEIGAVASEDKRKELRDKLDSAMNKGTALSQHAAIMTVRLVVRSLQKQAEKAEVEIA